MPVSPDNKQQLFSTLKNSSQAFDKLYQHYYPGLLKHCAHIIGNDPIAHETVADTFHALWNNRDSVAEMKYPEAWLKQCATNKAINARRGLMRRREMTLPEEMPLVSSENTQLSIEEKERHHKITKAILALPPQQAKIMNLYLQGSSRKQISITCRLSESTVKNHITEAIKKLRELLRDIHS